MNKTVLIVEDEFIVADDLQLTLEHAGYTVCGIAASVTEARELVLKKRPGLVLLDIHLKGKLNGIELAKELKEDSIAFVYLSANANQQILEAAKATEPYGFLVKPFRERDLLVTLDIAFYRHEHSVDARWRTEVKMQKALTAITENTGNLEQKMLAAAKALQAYIPFDCLAVKFNTEKNNYSGGIAFLRIGFDEYQVIGVDALAMISGTKPADIKTMLSKTPADYTAAVYNGDAFKQLFDTHPVKALMAKSFDLFSALVLPLATSDGYTFSFGFFRHSAEGYTTEQLNKLLRLKEFLTAILNSIPAEQKREAPPVGATSADALRGKSMQADSRFEGIIGNSPALLNVLNLLELVAPLDTSVLILGESGTGKERIADCIHRLSPRKNKPLIKINCAALPASLIESELFGHEKGAFTGASEKRTGKFEMANEGTIFLDEIGELPVELQVKLLRVLQEKEIERIGGYNTIKVNVRVIAATNRRLEVEMAEGRFRLDLYYRINTFPVTLPPLRERKEDIKALSSFFAGMFSKRYNKAFKGISEQMLSQLEAYDWPGNIRELENIIEQSFILNNGMSALTLRIPLPVKTNTSYHQTEDDAGGESFKTIEDIKKMQRQTEIQYISSVLKKTGGRIRGRDGAAALLNEKPTTLESRMAKLGIKKEDFI